MQKATKLVRTLSKIKFESKSQQIETLHVLVHLVRTLSKIKFESKSQLFLDCIIICPLVRTLSKIKFESKSQQSIAYTMPIDSCKNVVKDKI